MTGDIRGFSGFLVFARPTTDSTPLVALEYHAFVSVDRRGELVCVCRLLSRDVLYLIRYVFGVSCIQTTRQNLSRI